MINVLIIDDDEENLVPEIILKFKELNDNFNFKHVKWVRDAIKILKGDKSFDLMMLDIINMDFQEPEEAISRLMKVVPYVPIIMLSRQEIGDVIISCMDSGAKSYIIKSKLNVSPVLSKEEEDIDKKQWIETIDKIIKISREYQPIKRKLYNPKEIGWFSKVGDAKKSIIEDQIEFLTRMQQIRSMKNYFPQIVKAHKIKREIGKQKVDFWKYSIPCFNMKSLKKNIFGLPPNEDSVDLIKKAIREILRVTFEDIFIHQQEELDDPDKYIYETYHQKYLTRKKEILDLIIELEDDIGARELKSIINAEKIQIGEKIYRNPEIVIEELFGINEFKRIISPPKVGLIHGDLHFDNILIDLDLQDFINFKFIDPRGFKNSQDIAYDLGKMLHSAHGKYDFIHDGYYKVDIKFIRIDNQNNVNARELKFNEWIDIEEEGGGSRDITTSHVNLVSEGHLWIYDEIEKFIIDEIKIKKYLDYDEFWAFRSYFNEAMHFCTMLPFHYEKDKIRTISIFLKGIELINNAYDRYKSNFQFKR